MCKSCSEIRCKVYGIVSGFKTRFGGCGGHSCQVRNSSNYWTRIELGSTWSDFVPFLKQLGAAFVARITGK